jgi:DNA-binding transcriptional ArsR family regulator
MKLLVDAGLITREQRGKWAFYRIVGAEIAALAETVGQLARTDRNNPRAQPQTFRQTATLR